MVHCTLLFIFKKNQVQNPKISDNADNGLRRPKPAFRHSKNNNEYYFNNFITLIC